MEFWEVIHRGYNIWRKKPGICIPFLVGSILKAIAIAPIALSIAFIFLRNSILPYPLESPGLMTWGIIGLLIIALIVLIRAFEMGWGINICYRAYIHHLQGFPLPRFGIWAKLAIANLILMLILILGSVLMLPGILMMLPEMDEILEAIQDWIRTGEIPIQSFPVAGIQGLILMGIGALLWGIYGALISIMFSLLNMGIVIHELDPISGFRRALRIFSQNKLELTMLNLLVWGLYLGSGWILGLMGRLNPVAALGMGFGFSLISVLVIAPLEVSFFCGFYLDRSSIEAKIPQA